MKRFSSVLLAVLVCALSIIPPASATFAAGVTADNDTYITAPVISPSAVPTGATNYYFWDVGEPVFRTGVTGTGWDECSYSYSVMAVNEGNDPRIYVGLVMDHQDYVDGVVEPRYYPVLVTPNRNASFCAVGNIFGRTNSTSYIIRGISTQAWDYDINVPIEGWYTAFALGNNGFTFRDSNFQYSGNEFYCSCFDTVADLISAVESASPSPSPSSSLFVSVPAGNALLIGFDSTLAVKVSAKFSYPGYRNNTFYLTNQSYHISDQRRDDYNFTPSVTGSNNIPFSPVAPFLADGSSYYGEWNYATSVHQPVKYLVIFNPMYVFSLTANSASDLILNPSLTVSFSGNITEYRMIPLSTSGSIVSGLPPAQSASGSLDNSYVGSSSPGSSVVEWTNSAGEVVTPSVGGLTDPNAESDDGFWAKLSNIFSGFTSIFTWSYEAINSLIDAGSQFVSHLGSLYLWLPPQVLSVLSSALVLLIVIGVVKVLL